MRSRIIGSTVLTTLCLFCFSTQGFAKQNSSNTREVMGDVLESFVSLIPYMSSESTFNDPSKEKEIVQHLKQLKSSFAKTQHLKALKTPAFMPSMQSLNEHLDQTVKVFEAENKGFALTRLRSTTALCMSCHTQLPPSRRGAFHSALRKVGRQDFENDFEYAEFLFMTRNYMKSLRYYESSIQKRLENVKAGKEIKNKNTLYREVRQSLKRALSIYTKIRFNPSQAYSFLDKFDEHEGLSPMTKREIRGWMEQLESWKNRNLSFKLNSEKAISNFIDRELGPLKEKKSVEDGEKDVTLLVASGVLTKFLNYRPESSLTPRVLYWLAVADRQLDYNFFFSLADLYLKECIQSFSASPYAKKCFEEYKENVVYGYSGSAGTDIPEEEKEELKRLKSYLK